MGLSSPGVGSETWLGSHSCSDSVKKYQFIYLLVALHEVSFSIFFSKTLLVVEPTFLSRNF